MRVFFVVVGMTDVDVTVTGSYLEDKTKARNSIKSAYDDLRKDSVIMKGEREIRFIGNVLREIKNHSADRRVWLLSSRCARWLLLQNLLIELRILSNIIYTYSLAPAFSNIAIISLCSLYFAQLKALIPAADVEFTSAPASISSFTIFI